MDARIATVVKEMHRLVKKEADLGMLSLKIIFTQFGVEKFEVPSIYNTPYIYTPVVTKDKGLGECVYDFVHQSQVRTAIHVHFHINGFDSAESHFHIDPTTKQTGLLFVLCWSPEQKMEDKHPFVSS
jgi:hypothetical protein